MVSNPKMTGNHEVKKLLFFIGFLALTVYVFWQSVELGWLDILKNQEKMTVLIKSLGLLGPIAIIFLIAIAIIISPIPSAPVALVSGALYGHTFGTLYVILGALSGALSAFIIARKLGHDYVSKKLHSHLQLKMTGSQNMLMVIIFLTRLAPFISFDVISYAAGLTNLSAFRFFIATALGVIPISFVLAHLGSEISDGEIEGIAIALFLLGLLTALSVLISVLSRNNKE